jgi:tetratricopeptide (TPR) repeat protein
MNQANLGNVLTAAGHHRLARRHVRDAVAAASQTSDPLAVTWTQIVASLHWLGVGDWPALDAGLPRALEAGSRGRLHRAADQAVLLGGICRYLTGRFEEAAAMAAQARAAGRDRHDRMVQLWGLLILVESRVRTDPGDPAIADALEEAEPLLTSGIAVFDAVRYHVAAARFHLAAGRAPDAWRATRTGADLAGPEPSFAPYTLEAHAGIPEVSLALLERGQPPGTDPAELRATAAAGLRRLRRYARRFPMARPRALACLAWSHRLQGRPAAAARAWARAIREADRLAMPWEQANAHYQLGRHLRGDERSPLGLTGAEHLDRARSTFEALGCRAEPTGSAPAVVRGSRPGSGR